MSQTGLGFQIKGIRTKPSYNRRLGFLNAFIAASIVTGANWYIQKKWAQGKCAKEDEVIQRINQGQTTNLQQIAQVDNALHAQNIEGKKLRLSGELQPGRFIIKKNKGSQQGYIVLAPYIISNEFHSQSNRARPLQTKYMLNLGWIPKSYKNRIREASSIDVMALDDLPDHLADQDNPSILYTSTINAFVRKGEQQDVTSGRTNDRKNHLYKCIDLNLFSSLFGIVNHNSRFVYLDRAVQQGEQDSFPFPKTVDDLKEEIEGRKNQYIHTRNVFTTGVGVLSYLASLLAL